MVRRTALMLGLLACAAPAARAEDRSEAERYFRRGNELYAAGSLDEAARMFKVCTALVPQLPGPYRRLGQSYRRLGRCPEAVDQFLRYLEMRPKGKYAGEIREELVECAAKAKLETPDPTRPLTGQVALEADADGARVILDGRLVGRTPLEPLAIKPGAYTLRVELEGHEPWEDRVEVQAGETTFAVADLPERVYERPPTPGRLVVSVDPPGARVLLDGELVGTSPVPDLEVAEGTHEVRIERKGYLPETHTVEVSRGGQASVKVALYALPALPEPGAGQGPTTTAATPPTGSSAALRYSGWALVGIAALAVGVGATYGVLALDRASAYDQAGPLADRDATKEKGEGHALLADVALGSALALGIAGGALLWTNPAPPELPPLPNLEDHLEGRLPTAAPTVGWRGTF